MRFWKRMDEISWTDRAKMKSVMQNQGEECPTYRGKKKGELDWRHVA
jgi:hypothetical protein